MKLALNLAVTTLRRSTIPLVALIVLTGCNYSQLECYIENCAATAAPADSAGTLSYYSIITFYNPNIRPFCLYSWDQSCVYNVKQNIAAPLQSAGWQIRDGVTDGIIDGQYTSPDTTATNIIGETLNLLYLNSHGGITNGAEAQICLRQCDDIDAGNDYSVGPQVLPSAWNGPNWLVIDTCDAVQAGVGWEDVFGGSLHGILGFDTEGPGLSSSLPGSSGGSQQVASQTAGQATFTRLIEGFDSASDAWESAVAATNQASGMTMLIPSANTSDSIEASGGPHFGYNGDINPVFYFIQADGTVGSASPVAKFAVAPQSIYSLVPEQMNEAYWNSYYGGNTVPAVTTHPSANENLYRNSQVMVDHYLASGALLVTTAATGTARGFSGSDAYQYALNWLQENGGLPSDAVLTFAGDEVEAPTKTAPTSDEPYPNIRQYVFIWRHGTSGLLDNDKIQLDVDDAGRLTPYAVPGLAKYSPACQCMIPGPVHIQYVPPWVPVYHMHTYFRLWRTLGAPTQAYVVQQSASAYGYCSSDAADATGIAIPCGINSTSHGDAYVDLTTGRTISSSESL